MSDRIAVMAAGRIAQIGTPLELYERPASPFVGAFIGRINRLEGRVAAMADGLATITLSAGGAVRAPAALAEGAAALVMMRPHRLALREPAVALAAEHNRLLGRVDKVVYVGDLVQHHVATDGGRLIVEQATSGTDWQRFTADSAVAVDWRWRDSLAFPAETR
ncbi:MAG: TOBE domain-containing protein [Proteobacteria bacterium]|nr:TOBE domain-containing protein [Pseudomonadota bacterium]